MSVKIIMYGTHKRDAVLLKNKSILGLSDKDIIYDDRPNGGGPLYTCIKAWRSAQECEEDYVLALQDDVELCDNFKEIVNEISNFITDSFIGLITFDHKKEYIYSLKNESYFKTGFLYGPAIMIPTKYIKPCFDWIEKRYKNHIDSKADDEAISEYAQVANIQKIETYPCLVQHLNLNSLLGHCNGRNSSSYKKQVNFKVQSAIHDRITIDPMKNKWWNIKK